MLSTDHVQAQIDALAHPSLIDPQTGLANRLHFELVYSYLFEAGDRGMAFTVMLVATGATAPDGMREAGAAIRRVTRTSDLVSHIADGRFVVLLLGTNLQGARIVADRVETALAGTSPSFGLASYSSQMDASLDLLRAAERALAAAVAAGGGVEFGA
jgi:GGDEF domain-containing protein